MRLGELLAGDEPVGEPPVEGGGGDAELGCGVPSAHCRASDLPGTIHMNKERDRAPRPEAQKIKLSTIVHPVQFSAMSPARR